MTLKKLVFAMLGAALALILPSAFGSTYTIQIGSPNGSDDTAVLQGALDQCVTYHADGCTIRLSSGTYFSGPLKAKNFTGSILGNGMGTTVIEAITPFPESSGMLIFRNGNIAISNLTLRTTSVQPVADCPAGDYCGVTFLLAVGGDTAKASVSRVSFEGGPGLDSYGDYNVLFGVIFEGDISGSPELLGNLQVTGCRFRNMSYAIRSWSLADSHVTIGGSASDGNTFENHDIGLFIPEMNRTTVVISQNNFKNAGISILMNQGVSYGHDGANYTVEHNLIQMNEDYSYGIAINDLGVFLDKPKPSAFMISSNEISLANCPNCEGIEVAYAKGAVISNNKISGAAMDGIDIFASDSCIVMSNNLSGLTPGWAGILLLSDVAVDDQGNILFTIPTANCTLVGGNAKSNYYMDPDGTGNTIVGMNNIQGNPPGPAVRNAMHMKSLMKKGMIVPQL